MRNEKSRSPTLAALVTSRCLHMFRRDELLALQRAVVQELRKRVMGDVQTYLRHLPGAEKHAAFLDRVVECCPCHHSHFTNPGEHLIYLALAPDVALLLHALQPFVQWL